MVGMRRMRPWSQYSGGTKRFRANLTPRATASGNPYQRINRYVSRGPTTKGPLKKQVKSLQRVVRQLAPEIKIVDVQCDYSNVTTAGGSISLTPIAQGDTQSERSGNQIVVKSITVGGIFTRTASVPGTNAYYRFVVVVDKDPTPATPTTPQTVLQYANEPYLPFPNSLYPDRFRVLYMSQIFDANRMLAESTDITTNNMVPTQSAVLGMQWTGDIKVGFSGNQSTDYVKNGIFLLMLSNDGANTIDFDGLARVTYTDV